MCIQVRLNKYVLFLLDSDMLARSIVLTLALTLYSSCSFQTSDMLVRSIVLYSSCHARYTQRSKWPCALEPGELLRWNLEKVKAWTLRINHLGMPQLWGCHNYFFTPYLPYLHCPNTWMTVVYESHNGDTTAAIYTHGERRYTQRRYIT